MKFTVEFNPEAAAVIDKLALRKGSSKAEVVRRALNLLSYVEDEQAKNSKILVVGENGDTREIVPI